MKKNLLFLLLIFTISLQLGFGQVQFEKIYSGPESEWAAEAIECAGGGFAILGTTRSYGEGLDDISLIRTNVNGDILWSKTYGGPMPDYASAIAETPDGGFIVVGYTFGFGASGWSDLYVIRIGSTGDEIWSKVFHGDDNEQPQSVKNDDHGGFVIAGFTRSFGAGNKDYFLLQLDSSGEMDWSKTYGQSDIDDLYSLETTNDGGYIIAGGSQNFGVSESNIHLIKTNAIGDTLWTKAYRNEQIGSIGFCAKQTADGGYIIGSYSSSGFEAEYYVIRTDGNGDTLWTKKYRPTYCDDWCRSIRETADGGFIITGYSGCVLGINTIKIDASGDIMWSKNYEGLYNNRRVEITMDNGFIMLTYDETDSYGYDMRLIKTDESGYTSCVENEIAVIAEYTAGEVKPGPVTIENCPWEIVDPETIEGIAPYIDTTICAACDSITADFTFETLYTEVDFTDLSMPSTTWSWDFGDGSTSDEQHPTHNYEVSGTFTVCLLASNPLCGSDSICYEVIIEKDQSGILEQETNFIAIYPNPTKNQITFNTNSESLIENVLLLSLSGQSIQNFYAVNSSTLTIELKELSTGVYIAEIHTNQGVVIRKIIRD